MNPRNVFASFFGTVAFFYSFAPVAAGGVRVVKIDVVPSRFSPDTVVVKAGETTTLRFSVAGDHGLFAPGLGITHTLLSDGRTTDVSIAPQKVGVYVLHCRIFCGPGHADMTLTIVVTA